MCSISAAKMEGGLRSNWQHPCFQCNCTYLASHLRGSFRGSGLIEQSIVKWRGARSGAAQTVGPLRRSQLSPSLAHPLTRDTFNQSALIAPPVWLTNARASFLFIEISLITISQPHSQQPTLMGQRDHFKSPWSNGSTFRTREHVQHIAGWQILQVGYKLWVWGGMSARAARCCESCVEIQRFSLHQGHKQRWPK